MPVQRHRGHPSSTAIRRIDSAADPSASAIAIAVRTTSSRVTSTRGRAPRTATSAGMAGDPPATTVPTPCRAWTSPSCRNVVSTFVAVAIATPHSRVISRVDGTRFPGRSAPEAIRRRIASTIPTYTNIRDG